MGCRSCCNHADSRTRSLVEHLSPRTRRRLKTGSQVVAVQADCSSPARHLYGVRVTRDRAAPDAAVRYEDVVAAAAASARWRHRREQQQQQQQPRQFAAALRAIHQSSNLPFVLHAL